MKTYIALSLIALSTLIGLISIETVSAASGGTDNEVIRIFLSNLDTSLSKKTPEQKKIYFTRTIAQLETKINEYKEIQKILNKRLEEGNIASPIKNITGTVIDIGQENPSPVFQASECKILTGEKYCLSNIVVNSPNGKTFSLKNNTRNILTKNMITPAHFRTVAGWTNPLYSLSTSTYTNPANMLQYGENKLELLEGDLRIGSTVTLATCQTGAIWDGSVCSNGTIGGPLTQTGEVVMQGNPNIDPVIVPCKNTSIHTETSDCTVMRKIQVMSYTIDNQNLPYSGGIIKFIPTSGSVFDLFGTVGTTNNGSVVLISSTGKRLYAIYTGGDGSWKISNMQGEGLLQDGLNQYTLSFAGSDEPGIVIRIQKLSGDVMRSPDPIYLRTTRYGKSNTSIE